jgi:hypothetical protein
MIPRRLHKDTISSISGIISGGVVVVGISSDGLVAASFVSCAAAVAASSVVVVAFVGRKAQTAVVAVARGDQAALALLRNAWVVRRLHRASTMVVIVCQNHM